MIFDKGWLDVYRGWERWSEATLPPLAVGQHFVPSTLNLQQSRTQPPPLLAEADLIAVGRTLIRRWGVLGSVWGIRA
jgi:DNA topoisomerase IA